MPARPEATYLEELGWALYTFQALEWEVIASFMVSRGHDAVLLSSNTASGISAALTKEVADDPLMTGLAIRFKNLAERRNDLAHSRPATKEVGDKRLQRMYRYEVNRNRKITEWVDEKWLKQFIGDVQDLSREFQSDR